jgi:cation transport ATPase
MPIYAFARLPYKAKVNAMSAAVSGKMAKAWRNKFDGPVYDSAIGRGLRDLRSELMDDTNHLVFSGDSTNGIRLRFMPLICGLPADEAAVEQLRNNREEYLASLGQRYDTLSYMQKQTYRQLGRIRDLAENSENSKKVKEDAVHTITKKLSIAMFLLMPVLAVLLWLFFRKSRAFYAEHLIFSINAHTVAFLILGIALSIVNLLPENSSASGHVLKGSLLANAIYFFVSLRQVYGRGWGSTFFRFLILSFIYLLLLGVIFAASTLQGLLTF